MQLFYIRKDDIEPKLWKLALYWHSVTMDVSAAARNIHSAQNALQALYTTLHMTSYLFPPQADLNHRSTFDYIVVGAGSAGSVVATRLTEDSNVSVLLLEAGDDPPLESVLPGLYSYLKQTKWDWNYTSVNDGSQSCHKNEVTEMTRGKMLGGCSSNNNMWYVTGNPHDYDSWADIVRDESWSYKNILPIIKRNENMKDSAILNSHNKAYHGTNGNLGLTRSSNDTHKYLESFRELGHDIVLDINGKNRLGFSEALFSIADGIRQSTAYSFLGTAKARSNLFVMKYTLVTKILFDNNKNAIGVETLSENNEKNIFKATREVIISAGSINTPQLLMLSGIGPRKHLEEIGIRVIADLPVGENLQDHSPVPLMYLTENKFGPPKPKNPHEYPSPAIQGYVALNKSQTYPDYQVSADIVDSEGILRQCAFGFAFKDYICQKFYDESRGREVFALHVSNLHPKSRGRIELRSLDPKDHPVIHLGIFSNKKDLHDVIKYIKDVNRVAGTSYFKKVRSKLLTPPSCEGFAHDSQEHWSCVAQCMVGTIHHYVGTCAMGSVVDSRLRVYGVRKLRVIDGSVMPTITSENTNAPIIMIGQKGADMIKEDMIKY